MRSPCPRLSIATRWSVAALALVVVFGSSASAQEGLKNRIRQRRQNARPRFERTQLEGKLLAVQRTGLQVEDTEGSPYVVALTKSSRVTVSGEAELEWVRPGMLVRFNTVLDKRGKAKDDVLKLEVITASPAARPGVYDPNAAEGEAGGLTLGERKPGESSKLVIGQVRKFRLGKMTISTPVGALEIKVPDTAQVSVKVADLSVSQPGSAINVRGFLVNAYEGADPGRVVAEQLEVQLQDRLEAPSKKRKSRPSE